MGEASYWWGGDYFVGWVSITIIPPDVFGVEAVRHPFTSAAVFPSDVDLATSDGMFCGLLAAKVFSFIGHEALGAASGTDSGGSDGKLDGVVVA
jgi:hypothetical protein